MKITHKETGHEIMIDLKDNAAGYRERVYLAASLAQNPPIIVRARYDPHKDVWYTSTGIHPVRSEAVKSCETLEKHGYEFTDIPASEDLHQ